MNHMVVVTFFNIQSCSSNGVMQECFLDFIKNHYHMHLWFLVIPSPDGKRSMMKLAQRMVNNFCASINPSNGHQWTTHFGMNEVEVRSSLHKSSDPGQPSGVVLSAAATIWLPVSPQTVFSFFRDERTRPQVFRHI